jgi:methylase of polypeptide subunit release factors
VQHVDLLTAERAPARTLGAALRRIGYDEDAITSVLGEDAFGSGPEEFATLARHAPDSRLGTAVRLFFLEQVVARREAEAALGEQAVEALVASGLAAVVDDDVEPLARITGVGELLVASDRLSTDDAHSDPPDYVATYSPMSQRCDALTPRPEVDRALDLGTGNGVHALLAARHSRHVVATDVNPRALAYTSLNAALNDFDNVECRQGSLFEPVTGETFDLITCNAPFVVSPERRFVYRDGGMAGDEFSAQVVAGVAEHLADGGYATLLASWVGTEEDAPDERAIAWAQETGFHAWVLSADQRAPLEHAAEWNAPLLEDPDAYDAALDDWADYLDELGAAWVSEGAILLHRSDGTEPSLRVDEIADDPLEPAGDQILRAFAARVRLASLARPADLLKKRIALAGNVTVELDLEPRRSGPAVVAARVRLDEGMRQVAEAPPAVAEIVSALDGTQALDDALRALPSTERGRAAALVRELLELGSLELLD